MSYSDYYSSVSFWLSFLLFCRFSCRLYFLRNKFTFVSRTFSWVFETLSQTDALESVFCVAYEKFSRLILCFGAILIASFFS